MVILSIASGTDVGQMLQWLVKYCSPEMDRLAEEAEDVRRFFTTGSTLPLIGLDVHPQVPHDFTVDSVADSEDGIASAAALDIDKDTDLDITFGDGTNPVEHDALIHPAGYDVDGNAESRAGSPSGVADEVGSPLTPPPDSGDESERKSQQELPPPPDRPLSPKPAKHSGRVVKPPKRFTSGATLTQAPSKAVSKKRKSEPPATPEITNTQEQVSQDTLFWADTIAFHSAAVSPRLHFPEQVKC